MRDERREECQACEIENLSVCKNCTFATIENLRHDNYLLKAQAERIEKLEKELAGLREGNTYNPTTTIRNFKYEHIGV